MREIKFRGKTLFSHEWKYGSLMKDEPQNSYYIMDNETGDGTTVDNKTIGQFTGLYDKNKVPIYEGDIVETKYGKKYTVEFKTERAGFYPFACGDGCGCCEEETWSADCSEILGNIYENSDLLGE